MKKWVDKVGTLAHGVIRSEKKDKIVIDTMKQHGKINGQKAQDHK